MKPTDWFVYIAKARDNSLYTGISPDPKARIKKHNLGTGAKSLRPKLPVSLVYLEKFPIRNQAAKREAAIKNWKREYKIKLVRRNQGFTF